MAQPLTSETLVYDLRLASEPQVAPDGGRIAYTLSIVERESGKDSSQIWLCAIDGGAPRRLTWTGQQNRGARWSPDGRSLAFTSERVKRSGIFLLPVDEPGEARELARHNQGIAGLSWSPDGSRIAYLTRFDPDNPDEADPAEDVAPKVRATRRIDYKRDGQGYLGDARDQVWIVDVASGERRRLTTELAEHRDPRWSPDGRRLAIGIASWASATSRLLLIDVDSGEQVFVGPDLAVPEAGQVNLWSWSPAGDRIVFAGETHWTAQPNLYVYEVATGAVRRLTDDLDCLPLAHPVWLDERRVLIHAAHAGASGLYVLDSEHDSLERVQSWTALHDGLSVDDARRYVVQARTSLEEVGELAVHDLRAGTTRTISSHNAAVLHDALPAKWERIEVQRGQLTIEAWLLTPPDFDPTRRYPLVLDVHGGPESFYGYRFSQLQQCLATNDVLVLAANPRGSTSYGRRFTDAVLNDWGVEPLADLLAVLDRVLERPYTDAARVGITGGSYGGYMTAWALGQTQRFAAAVCVAVTFDLESQYQSGDFDHAYGDYAWGGPPHQNRAWYDAQSPSSFAHRATTPTLILHGEEDQRCPIGQAEQMFTTLKKAGCEAEFVRYPGGAHGFTRSGPPLHRVDALERTLTWFKRHLGAPSPRANGL